MEDSIDVPKHVWASYRCWSFGSSRSAAVSVAVDQLAIANNALLYDLVFRMVMSREGN